MALCHECGWACDTVQSDYGEDLIVQSCHNGEVDPFRILVQVRATERFRKSDDAPKVLRINREHGLRWLRNREPVIVALWSVTTKSGWFVLPREQLDEYELLTAKQDRFPLAIDPGQQLQSATLTKLVWQLRLNYFRDRLLIALNRDQIFFIERAEGIVRSKTHKSHVPTILFELFQKVGIVTPKGLSKAVRSGFKNARRNLRQGEKSLPLTERSSDRDLTGMAATLCFLNQVELAGAQGVPRLLVEFGGERLAWLLTRRSL